MRVLVGASKRFRSDIVSIHCAETLSIVHRMRSIRLSLCCMCGRTADALRLHVLVIGTTATVNVVKYIS